MNGEDLLSPHLYESMAPESSLTEVVEVYSTGESSDVSFTLGFGSACEFEMFHLVGILEGEEWAGNEIHLQATFLDQCANIEWAGQLSEEDSFAVTQQPRSFLVTVRNVEAPNQYWSVNSRLQHVYLEYRRINTAAWSLATTNDNKAADFINDESVFG